MSALLEHVMAPEVRPFAIAAAMILIVGSVEVVSMLVGASLSEMLGTNIDFGHPSDNGVINAISWINVGGVPLLIFLLLLLGAFSITGFLIQDVARMVAGPLPATIASAGAIAVSIPLVRAASGAIARSSFPRTKAMPSVSAISSAASVRSSSVRSTRGRRAASASPTSTATGTSSGRLRRPHRDLCRREPWSFWSIASAPASWRSKPAMNSSHPNPL